MTALQVFEHSLHNPESPLFQASLSLFLHLLPLTCSESQADSLIMNLLAKILELLGVLCSCSISCFLITEDRIFLRPEIRPGILRMASETLGMFLVLAHLQPRPRRMPGLHLNRGPVTSAGLHLSSWWIRFHSSFHHETTLNAISTWSLVIKWCLQAMWDLLSRSVFDYWVCSWPLTLSYLYHGRLNPSLLNHGRITQLTWVCGGKGAQQGAQQVTLGTLLLLLTMWYTISNLPLPTILCVCKMRKTIIFRKGNWSYNIIAKASFGKRYFNLYQEKQWPCILATQKYLSHPILKSGATRCLGGWRYCVPRISYNCGALQDAWRRGKEARRCCWHAAMPTQISMFTPAHNTHLRFHVYKKICFSFERASRDVLLKFRLSSELTETRMWPVWKESNITKL